jgi:hypothetical protein
MMFCIDFDSSKFTFYEAYVIWALVVNEMHGPFMELYGY